MKSIYRLPDEFFFETVAPLIPNPSACIFWSDRRDGGKAFFWVRKGLTRTETLRVQEAFEQLIGDDN
jgi:hypothetical protein